MQSLIYIYMCVCVCVVPFSLVDVNPNYVFILNHLLEHIGYQSKLLHEMRV
jgi:hypothetical protein